VCEGVSRVLISQTPGSYQRFFEEAGKAVDDEAEPLLFKGEPEVQEIVTNGCPYGIEIPESIAQRSRA
jgi:hypothetical protein